MHSHLLVALFAIVAVTAVTVACGSDDGNERRVISIVQSDEACSPTQIEILGGERLTFAVKNEGKRDQEIEGIDGTKLEEVLIPSGKTRNINYTAPQAAGLQKFKCYAPGGQSTIIEATVSGTAANAGKADSSKISEKSYVTTKAPNSRIGVSLESYSVKLDTGTGKKGPIQFSAINMSKTETHELAVLRVKSDGTFENTGEIEDIAPGKSGDVVLDLPAGKYVLACLIAPGEAGSTQDHFKLGMRTDFTIQ